MPYLTITLIALGILALLLLVWLFFRWRKRRKNAKMMEAETLQDFEFAEKTLLNSKGKLNPQEILWQIAQSRNKFKPEDDLQSINLNNNQSNIIVRRDVGEENEREINNLSGIRTRGATAGSGIVGRSQNTSIPKLRSGFDGRKDIQNISDPISRRDPTGNSQVRRNSRKSLFGRR